MAGQSGAFLGAVSAPKMGTSYVDIYASDSWYQDFSLSLPYVVQRTTAMDWADFYSLNGVYVFFLVCCCLDVT
jgi:hypothetical protein